MPWKAGDASGHPIPLTIPRPLPNIPHHPPQPQAGLTGCAQSYIPRGHVWWGLQRLDLSRRLAGGTGAHDVHLAHAEAGEGNVGVRWRGQNWLGWCCLEFPRAPLPVVGEGVQARHLHRAGIRHARELVDELPVLPLPHCTHLQGQDRAVVGGGVSSALGAPAP